MFVVEEATGLPGLAARLNALESQGFDPSQIILLGGHAPRFVIVACRSDRPTDAAQPEPPGERASSNQSTTRLSPAELVERWRKLS